MLFRYKNATLEFNKSTNDYVVKMGSLVSVDYKNINDNAKSADDRRNRVDRARQTAKKQGWDGNSKLNRDIHFTSSSSAADFVAGDWKSGTQAWKNDQGQALGDYKFSTEIKQDNKVVTDVFENKNIKEIVSEYIKYVSSNLDSHVKDEGYKFDALRHFQITFNIDAEDIANNLKSALSKVDNLAIGASYYPISSLNDIATNKPEEVRNAFRVLFSNDTPELERIGQFQKTMSPLSQQYSHKTTSYPYNMDLRFISLLLSLRFPSEFIYFKPTQVDMVYQKIYGEKTGTRSLDASRMIKYRDLGKKILAELETRAEYKEISDAMGNNYNHNLWLAQDVIWYEATSNNSDVLTQKVIQYMDDNPNWRENKNWPLTQDQIDSAVADFQVKFSPDKLMQMSDEELLRWMPYRQVTTNDGLSYMLEFGAVTGKMGGIGGGSAGKMGYYQGKDGDWKTLTNKVTTKEDVILHRRIDVEVLNAMYGLIESDNFDGLEAYTNSLKEGSTDAGSGYKAVIPGLVWVRKYFTILFPEKFVQLYGREFVKKLESIAGIGEINGDGKDFNYSLWYKKINKISAIATELKITNYELSIILWGLASMNSQKEDQVVDKEAEPAISISLNTIIYGPPGTGKTYSISDIKKNLIGNQHREFINPLEGLTTWGDAIFRVYTENNYRSLSINEITNSPFMKAYAATRNSKTPYGTIATQIIGNATEESTNSTYRLGTDKFQKNDKKWSLTEIGRAEAEELNTALQTDNSQTEDVDYFFKFITFHQSYGYEEFIEGIRAETTDSGNISYVVRDGVFKSFCRRAEIDPKNNYLFVIDEINRGNISKIFGELITLVEPNKRLGAVEQITTTLPYSGDKFGVPKNVFIVGTMNTADRSIALLDIALRRRFDFREVMPNPLLLSEDLDGVNLQRLLVALNTGVIEKIDRNHQIGHSYLMGVKSLSELQNAWYQRIIPLLQEYFYDDNSDLRSILKVFIDKDEIVQFDGELFKEALVGIYEEAQSPYSGIQL